MCDEIVHNDLVRRRNHTYQLRSTVPVVGSYTFRKTHSKALTVVPSKHNNVTSGTPSLACGAECSQSSSHICIDFSAHYSSIARHGCAGLIEPPLLRSQGQKTCIRIYSAVSTSRHKVDLIAPRTVPFARVVYLHATTHFTCRLSIR